MIAIAVLRRNFEKAELKILDRSNLVTTMRTKALINDFAIRSFRDTADGDYIAARMAFRAALLQQFFWSSLQAVGKYIQCILLLNRIPAQTMRHNLRYGLDKINNEGKFKLRLLSTVTSSFNVSICTGATGILKLHTIHWGWRSCLLIVRSGN